MSRRKLPKARQPFSPKRIEIPPPLPAEELRQLAEAVADLHYVMGLIIEYADEFIPGEAIEELGVAWEKSEKSFERLVRRLINPNAQDKATDRLLSKTLAENELIGDTGKAKRSTLLRLKDRFFRFFYSHPYTNKKHARAADAFSNYLEFGATVVSSIPGCDAIEEIILLVKQLISIRAKRGGE